MEFYEYEGLEQHHVKYLERDGVDEIILVTPYEHGRIHKELHSAGVRTITKEIIFAAHLRSPRHEAYEKSDKRKEQRKKHGTSIKTKQTRHEYYKNRGGRDIQHKYRKSEAGILAKMESLNNTEYITFLEPLGEKVGLREKITFNKNTGHVGYTAYFRGYHCELPVITIDN